MQAAKTVKFDRKTAIFCLDYNARHGELTILL